MNAPLSVAQVRQGPSELASIPDQAVDMFTERGFHLANRVAKAFASSDAVPVQFRTHVLKKVGNDEHWVENPAAVGNCLVAIEVARAVGMSIAAVMQNADMIEGKLRWSGKFVISAINTSGRFTPLRFQMINRGKIKASYKEKTGWDKEARRPIFTERSVEVDDIECIAWALPKGYPEPRVAPEQMREYRGRMLDLYRDLGLPVVESAPVTMKMAVEEGWYSKPGSKWQTEMRVLMFQYRSGSFFGNIHAPDIVMGMGQTSEEARDTQVLDLAPDGTYTVTSESLRADMRTVDQATGEITHDPSPVVQQQAMPAAAETVESQPASTTRTTARQQPAAQAPAAQQQPPAFDLDAFANRISQCTDLDALDVMADEVNGLARDQVVSDEEALTLHDVYLRRREDLLNPPQAQAAAPAPAPAPAAPLQGTSRRRAAAPGTAPE